jgi:hypothetical protein
LGQVIQRGTARNAASDYNYACGGFHWNAPVQMNLNGGIIAAMGPPK